MISMADFSSSLIERRDAQPIKRVERSDIPRRIKKNRYLMGVNFFAINNSFLFGMLSVMASQKSAYGVRWIFQDLGRLDVGFRPKNQQALSVEIFT
jgi:hypothetical protein